MLKTLKWHALCLIVDCDDLEKSFITGKFCHNHRLERLWRENFTVNSSIVCFVFWYLEGNKYRDISSEVYLYFLYLVLCPVNP